MDSIVICSNNIIDTSVKVLDYFYLDEIKIPIAIIEAEANCFEDLSYNKDCVVVKKIAFSLNYRDRSVIYGFINKLNIISSKQNNVALFSPLGSEFVGEIIAKCANVKYLEIGDRVIPVAPFPYRENKQLISSIPINKASKRIQLLHKDQLLKIPEYLPDEIAASLTISGQTVYSMIERAGLKAGDNVMIPSLKSNISLAIVSALKDKRVNIWGITTNSHFVKELAGTGINKIVVNENQIKDFLDINDLKKFVEKTGGFDVVFDPFSDLHLGKIISCMSYNSVYITCGLTENYFSALKRGSNYTGKSILEILKYLIANNISVIGNYLGEKRHLEQAIDEYLKGNFDIPIDSVITGNDIAYFFDRTFNDPNRFGKVVYKYDD